MNEWLVDEIETQEYQARKSLLYPFTARLFESVGFLITPPTPKNTLYLNSVLTV